MANNGFQPTALALRARLAAEPGVEAVEKLKKLGIFC
jgi:hypothetical protein